ncbi:MAG: hypothetical protein P1U81_12915 [Verrucomicrobiales bacterium]|nr:hypothetical protein [Verrucomicrobiales bacterium]
MKPTPDVSSTMNNYQWDSQFTELFERCLERYRNGDEDFTGYYNEADQKFLESFGYKPREFFDFVEDFGDGGEPTLTTAILVASARRDYFKWEMDGELGTREIKPADLPGKGEELDGIVWLPRIIMKAVGKLRGELDPDIMFCCGGDRKFLRTRNIAPADFLRAVWSTGGDAGKMVDFVRSHTAG